MSIKFSEQLFWRATLFAYSASSETVTVLVRVTTRSSDCTLTRAVTASLLVEYAKRLLALQIATHGITVSSNVAMVVLI